ncbi:hypothetical protein OAJ86_00595 [Nitrosopumilus sp.]|nr:hypothetical protein [Nitrosopumilus sp.]
MHVLHPSYHTEQLSGPIVGRVDFGFSTCITLLSSIPTVKRIKNMIIGNMIIFFGFMLYQVLCS